ncbi:MAG: glycosyltransferase family 2 protein [Pseudorhodobacter sp.]|nr:MAG: glycosyltransferase family 2 protein [Pseudorhodobacter sp.]
MQSAPAEPPPQAGGSDTLVVSIVSHGHGAMVQRLLEELAQWSASAITRVVITHNLKEAPPRPPAGGWPFGVEVLHNRRPQGFGFNHNQALRNAPEALVCVLNPDVGLGGADPFTLLKQVAAKSGVGCAYPEQVDELGRRQDAERSVPSPSALWARRGLGRADTRVDWVNAACLVIPGGAWRALGGFDERYYMYCEDVDFSLRLQLGGWRIERAPVQVIHGAQRASSRSPRHFLWHVASLLRFWRSPVYRQSLQMVTDRSGAKVTIDPS